MMFDIARKMPKPVVIFIDEGDSLFKSRTSGVSAYVHVCACVFKQ
jgi:hypothetical protein